MLYCPQYQIRWSITLETAQDFLNLFVNETGELLYFISIFVIYQAAFLMAFDQSRRSATEPAASRYAFALGLVGLAWLALMGGALYSVVSEDTSNLLPPLERAVNAIVLVFLGWGILNAEYNGGIRISAIFALILASVLAGGFVYTFQNWDPNLDFNVQDFSVSWTFIPLLIAFSGILLSFFVYNHVADIPLKLLFFALIFAGHFYTMIQLVDESLEGDAAGAIRWGYMTSSALIVVLVYRMVIDRMTDAIDEVATYAETVSRPQKAITTEPSVSSSNAPSAVPDIKRVTSEMQRLSRNVTGATAGTSSFGGRNEAMELIKALGIMLDKEETQSLPQQIVIAVADTLKADVVAIVSHDDANWADVIAAYDTAKKSTIPGMSINLGEQPTLVSAIQNKRQHKLELQQNGDELTDLYTRLDIPQPGPTYVQPLTRNAVVVGLLIIGLPYTRRDLRSEELQLLGSIAPIAARLLVISRTALINRIQAEEKAILDIVEGNESDYIIQDESTMTVRKEMQQSLDIAQSQINELERHIQSLENELHEERFRVRELLDDGDDTMGITERIEAISYEREQLQFERRELAKALKEAQTTLVGVTAEGNTDLYASMIESMKQELRDLQSQKERLEQQLSEIRSPDKSAAPITNQADELIKTISDEKSQIAHDRDNIAQELQKTTDELKALGIEGGVQDLAKQLAQLTEERAHYKAQAEQTALDRDMLIKERQRLSEAIAQEAAREAKIKALEEELSRMMQDREALSKNRDGLKAERSIFANERDKWFTERVRMLAHNDSLKIELDETFDLLNHANQERQELASERNQLTAERDILRAELARSQHERDSLMARAEGDRDRLQAIGDEGVGTMTKMIDELTQERTELENKLLETQQNFETLQRELNRLSTQKEAASNGDSPSVLSIDMDVIVSLAQELRTPLSVIMGYTETVLSESVGILGALQRKLLTRVKANIDRLGYLVEELIQIVALDSGDLRLQPQKVNLVDVVDDAITASRYKFSEKGIVLDLDIEEETLFAQADPEALQQIIEHLMQNAYLVSPTDGTVQVIARNEPQYELPPQALHRRNSEIPIEPKNVVFLSIKDQGGGINPDDEKRVFSRLYRADSPLIAGLGDTGVGMSITKALIEAHGGHIWLESEQGVGNTFKFVLPVDHPFKALPQSEDLVETVVDDGE